MGAQYREETFESFDGTQLFLRSWRPENPGACVGIVHGSFEHGGRYAGTAGYLAARGFAVHVFDLRGHGRSPGARAGTAAFAPLAADVTAFARNLGVAYPAKPLFLLAHSAGAAFTLAACIESALDVRGVVISAPALALGTGIPRWVSSCLPLLEKTVPRLRLRGLNPRFLSRDPKVAAAYRTDPLVDRGGIPAAVFAAFLRFQAELTRRLSAVRVPLLILQGTGDRIVDPRSARTLYEAAASQDKTLRYYEGFYHEVLNEPEKERVLVDISAWLAARSSA